MRVDEDPLRGIEPCAQRGHELRLGCGAEGRIDDIEAMHLPVLHAQCRYAVRLQGDGPGGYRLYLDAGRLQGETGLFRQVPCIGR